MSQLDDERVGSWITEPAGEIPVVHDVGRIEVVDGPDVGLVVDLPITSIVVGARGDCDLQLHDPTVSGRHLEIRSDERGLHLHDLGSRNGTWIGALRIRDAYVEPESVVEIGTSRLRLTPALDSPGSAARQLVVESQAMRALLERIERVAASSCTVLLLGETGTGKELVAETIHRHSARARRPFVILDCAAVPSSLAASEILGHERGAFTGAVETHPGAFERSHGGTLLLDDVGELPLDVQPILLRTLARPVIQRIGGSKAFRVDVRVIAATHVDLAAAVRAGRFREDLYHRLNVVPLTVPPLRERREDLPRLIQLFLDGRRTLGEHTLDFFMRHDWPGNVRELRNILERHAVFGRANLAMGTLSDANGSSPPAAEPALKLLEVVVDASLPFKAAKQALIDLFEREYLEKLLSRHRGNLSAAARSAGLDRMSIYNMLDRQGRRR